MKKQASIRPIVLMALLVIAATLTAPRALLGSQAAAPDNRGLKEFSDCVEAYEKVREKAEKSLPKFKKKSKQEVIAVQQQALVTKIRELRSTAQRGDIFTVSATEAIAQTIKAVFAGPDGHRVQNTIQTGEPLRGFEVQVNQRYPDSLPFTTVPPTLLRKLPRLPDEVAYRILGSDLLLVDRKANLIVDFIPNAIP
jgi:transcriptional regulator with PAS, ATPase and Fis domain